MYPAFLSCLFLGGLQYPVSHYYSIVITYRLYANLYESYKYISCSLANAQC